MTLEAAETGDSDGDEAPENDDDDDAEDDEAEDMENFQESGLLDEVDPVIICLGFLIITNYLNA